MGLADHVGRARVDPSRPDAFGECDDCGFWWNRRDLRRQMEYTGDGGLFWTGFYVCPTCYDQPQPQLITPVLPADPLPIIEPRPFIESNADLQMGFQIFALQPFWEFEIDLPPGSQAASAHKASALQQLATLSGVATPGGYSDEAGTLATARTTQQLVGANPARSWIAVINPTELPIVVSTGQASFATGGGQVLGPGLVLFWATAEGFGPPWTGALTAQGLADNQPFWLFEYPGGGMPPVPVVMP